MKTYLLKNSAASAPKHNGFFLCILFQCLICLTFTLKPSHLPVRRYRYTPSTILKDAVKLDVEHEISDYVIIGSGIGGLSCAALLSYYGAFLKSNTMYGFSYINFHCRL